MIDLITDYHTFMMAPHLQSLYLFESKIWKLLKLKEVALTKVYRQQEDPIFEQILRNIARNTMTFKDHHFFHSRDLSKRWNADSQVYEPDPDFNPFGTSFGQL
jgi:hypothetical protein